VKDGNWIQTVPGKGWSTILRLYSPLDPFFTKQWRPSEIDLVRHFMVDNTKVASAFCAALCAIAIGAYRLDAFQQSCCPGINETARAILNLVNTKSGASESSKSGETVWTYSLNLADPCTLHLTEQKLTLRKENSNGSVTPIREITHYLIPAADLEFGAFSTHHTLEQGYMRVVLWTNRATIRRWHGHSSTPPEDAPVIFDVAINFGKPNVDIFEVPLLFQDALMHLTGLCRAK
jgi:hypothetical protein